MCRSLAKYAQGCDDTETSCVVCVGKAPDLHYSDMPGFEKIPCIRWERNQDLVEDWRREIYCSTSDCNKLKSQRNISVIDGLY